MAVYLEIIELIKEVNLRRSVRDTAEKAFKDSSTTMLEDHLGIQRFKLRRSEEKLLKAIAFRNAHPVTLQVGDHT